MQGTVKVRQVETERIARVLEVNRGELFSSPGGVLTVSVQSRVIGWTRLDRLGRLSWDRRDLSKVKNIQERITAACQYIAHVIRFERPGEVVFIRRSIRGPSGLLGSQVYEIVKRLIPSHSCRITWCDEEINKENIRMQKQPKFVNLAKDLFETYPQLEQAMSLDLQSPAAAFNVKYWRSVLVSLAINHQIHHEKRQSITQNKHGRKVYRL